MANLHPRQILTNMIDNVATSASNLLTISSRYFVENQTENAIYGVALGKPSKRLSTLLSVNREILILFSSFVSQQARTVRTINKIIADSNGRLEPTVSIVVHPDPRGNANLKIWGRENGISILPIYYVEGQYPIEFEQFENMLCREMFSVDPFDITGPVSDDSQFYGRRTEAQTIARQLQLGQVKAILGIRKIGKTSILNRIIDTCNTYHKCSVVMVDCSKDEIWSLNAADLLYSLFITIKALKENGEKYSILKPHKAECDASKSTTSLIEIIQSCNEPVIAAFDELDYITPGSPTGHHWANEFNIFWRNFRVVYQECLRIKKPFSVIIGGVSSKWFRVESINGVENAALSIVPEDYLGPLPRGASIAMIKSLSRVTGLQFLDSTADLVAHFCCDSPYWIRKACSYIHKKIDIQNRPLKIDITIVRSLLEEFVDREGAIIAKIALEHLFRVYPELKDFCKLSFDGKIEEIPKTYLNILQKYGLVKETNFGYYDFTGEMIKEGLDIIFDGNSTTEINEVIPEALVDKDNSYEEWADELALIGKRRNILERKLRNIVLNFMRQDSLLDKNKPRLKERICNRIEEKNRKRLQHMGSDEIMDKLLWTELCVIIIKEWSLFEKIFNDKNLFNLNSTIINDRPDAHAKSVDAADLALYRRSLSWLEGCIDSI